jgi:hypothetical protein
VSLVLRQGIAGNEERLRLAVVLPRPGAPLAAEEHGGCADLVGRRGGGKRGAEALPADGAVLPTQDHGQAQPALQHCQ